MSSLNRRQRRSDDVRWSAEEFESIADSEEPISSVIRLPRAKPFPSQDITGPSAPPPLPPKPAFARGTVLLSPEAAPPLPPKPTSALLSPGAPPPLPPRPVVVLPSPSAPPPLPPKPENVRGEKLVDLSQKKQSPAALISVPVGTEQTEAIHITSFLPPPTRPLPAIPGSHRKSSYGEDGSWVPSNLDERSQLDPPQPPEPTIVSDGEPMRSSLGNLDTSTQSFSDQVPNLTLPLPPPPYTAQNHRISSAFPPIPSPDQSEHELSEHFISLSEESAEDSHIGAIVLSRERLKREHVAVPLRPAPIQWRLYTRQEPGGEAWSVLHEYLTNVSLKAHGRNRALQLLTGYVVGACLESTEAGIGLLSEIVRRMRGAERSERDGSIFTLLINIAAHASFVHKLSWTSVEDVARKVFSDVVEEMHGRQDDDVMWERALRCYLVLLKSSNRRPSEQISSRCLAALALHMGDLTHTDVDHVIVTEGICPRLQSPNDERTSSAGIDFGCLQEIGGLETVLTIYADTASLSARHSLFRVIYDVAVLKCLENVPDDDMEILKDHILTFRALLEAYEMADCLVHTFRVGPWPDFVMDTITVLLFDPLTRKALDSLTGRSSDEVQNSGKKVLQEKAESLSFSETRLSGTIGRAYRSSASKYLLSIRALVKLLDKPFCLKVIQQFEKISAQHAKVLSQRKTMHYAREWKILCDVEAQLQLFVFGRGSNPLHSVSETLTKLYVATVDITSGRSNLKSVLQMAETVVDFFTVKPPFSKCRCLIPTPAVDNTVKMFLKGQLIVAKQLLQHANPSIFTLLLLATNIKIPSRRLSECRQCLVEFLGSSQDRADLLQTFTDDDDSAVAYRASELVSKFGDVNLQPIPTTSAIGEAC